MAAHLSIIIGLYIRVVMRRRPVGVSLSWLILIFILPFAGAILYFLIGEQRLGRQRAKRARELLGPYEAWLHSLPSDTLVDWSTLTPTCQPINRLAESIMGIPAKFGNKLDLIHEAESVLRSIITDIDRAQRTCHLEFYQIVAEDHGRKPVGESVPLKQMKEIV